MSPKTIEFDQISTASYVKLIKKEWTIDQYKDFWNKYANENPSILKNFKGRKDKRNLGEFAVELATNKELEINIIKKWVDTCNKGPLSKLLYGTEVVEYYEYGVESSGKLILQNGNKKLFKKADFLLQPINKPIDCKNCPVDYKLSLKIADLEFYKKEQADVLIMMKNKFFIYFTTKQYTKIMDYANTSNAVTRLWEVGHKPGIQLFLGDREKHKRNLNHYAIPLEKFEHVRVDINVL